MPRKVTANSITISVILHRFCNLNLCKMEIYQRKSMILVTTPSFFRLKSEGLFKRNLKLLARLCANICFFRTVYRKAFYISPRYVGALLRLSKEGGIPMIDFKSIKENLDLIDTARHYGVHITGSNMINCLFHDDKNPSMKLYHDHFYCFG